MFELMDDISELVYIADMETYELLYMNERGKADFSVEEWDGRPCYEVLQGLSSPCAFCTNHLLNDSSTYTWEHYNPLQGRSYLLKDRLIQWQGRKARLEVAFDVTEHSNQRRGLEAALRAEQMVLHCVEKLNRATNLDQGINDMLEHLGQELSAERAYIFEVRDGQMSNTFEWCADGVVPQIGNLQAMNDVLLERWLSYFQRGECVILEDLETIQGDWPNEYTILKGQNIRTLVTAPLDKDGELTGFVGVDNPVLDGLENIAPMLTTLRYFLMATIHRMEDEQRLTRLSFHDTLTGLLNRNRHTRDLTRLEHCVGSLGVVYLDLNGLKEINDRQGHAAGDVALVYCAEALRASFPRADCYRIGGDEFVVLAPGISQATFREEVEQLRARFGEGMPYRAAIGVRWAERPADLDRMMLAADTAMYDDKRKFYRGHTQSGRYRRFGDERAVVIQEARPLGRGQAIDRMRVGISRHLVRSDLKIVWANDCFYRLLGYTREEFCTQFQDSGAAYYATMPEEYQRLNDLVSDAFQTGKPGYEAVLHLPVKGGGATWLKLVGTFSQETIDGLPLVDVVCTDVSDLVCAQREHEAPYDGLPVFILKLQVASDGLRLLYGNRRFQEMFGSTQGGWPALLLNNGEIQLDWAPLNSRYGQLREGADLSLQLTAQRREGGERTFRGEAVCVDRLGEDPVYFAVFTDVSDLTDREEELYALAYTDPVTGGRNRARFELDAGNTVSTAPPGTYVMASLDIQKFKVINDLFGIENGDRTLCHVYRTIEQHLRPGEYAARTASDTFGLLLWAEGAGGLEGRVAALTKAVNQYNQNLEHKYYLVLTVGFYTVDDPALPIIQMQDRANIARQKSKLDDLTQLYACRAYSHRDRSMLAWEAGIENRMYDALQMGQFQVYFQPKQDLRTGQVAGAEALVRWQDPQRGLMPPDQFIPLFERNGFITQLDLYVFEQTCAMIARWMTEGKRAVPVSVNMSRMHLRAPNFLQRYENIRRRYGVPASLLEIEVTETMVFEYPQVFATLIDEIHRRGYRCSMDDFGSGYSSLACLKDIRVDTLKLDRAFFSSATLENPWEGAIITGVIALARKLQMRTVAEGVTTPQQREFLHGAECDMIQGFLFSQPLPMERFEALLFEEKP